ncbi:class F sortase [Streptomyces sp. HNM0663]|uniref:Class F sortase n=1 Tax=Streptomyces chengmaiensis TaxID=3040919 RepID=A0ABT6HY40_9ACTN|nr:class F sortase [Streptomyces chengmaiensis]MDH2393621.1 class F sortase [Streptomyces chengmaiensis]
MALVLGVWLVQNGSEDVTPPVPSAEQSFTAGPGLHTRAAADPLPPAAPVQLRIPAIGVDTPLMRLGLDGDGSLEAPPAVNRNLAGWYRDGTPPGANGTAIIAGHVDNAQGPAVFYRLGALGKGRLIEVTRADGRTAVFTVDAVEVYDAEDFPDDKVYRPRGRAELRVITCGGGFDEKTGYRGNVVAYAHLTDVREPGAAPGRDV